VAGAAVDTALQGSFLWVAVEEERAAAEERRLSHTRAFQVVVSLVILANPFVKFPFLPNACLPTCVQLGGKFAPSGVVPCCTPSGMRPGPTPKCAGGVGAATLFAISAAIRQQ